MQLLLHHAPRASLPLKVLQFPKPFAGAVSVQFCSSNPPRPRHTIFPMQSPLCTAIFSASTILRFEGSTIPVEGAPVGPTRGVLYLATGPPGARSEERRVGKECR